jgi:hypothetical protein
MPYFGSEFGKLLDPVVKDHQGADDEKRAEVLSLAEISIECDRLDGLWEFDKPKEECTKGG